MTARRIMIGVGVLALCAGALMLSACARSPLDPDRPHFGPAPKWNGYDIKTGKRIA